MPGGGTDVAARETSPVPRTEGSAGRSVGRCLRCVGGTSLSVSTDWKPQRRNPCSAATVSATRKSTPWTVGFPSGELAANYGVASLEDAYLALVGRKELSRSRVQELAS